MQPLISYWSATMSPGLSCGRNEYGLPQCGHQPSIAAGVAPFDRPTGRLQFQQNRFDSATTGLVINAVSGSFVGTRGISTSPPPSRRVGDICRATVTAMSCGSVSSPPSVSGWSPRCGRNTAWVAIGRMVDMVSRPRSSKLAGWVPTVGPADVVSGAGPVDFCSDPTVVSAERVSTVGSEPTVGSAGGVPVRASSWFWFTSVSGIRRVRSSGVRHQSTYLATGGAGAGPNTVNHLRYKVFHVPSRRIRSSVPLTNRTSPGLFLLMPVPYGSWLILGPTMCRYGSCAISPARIESSVLTAST